jgi:hypothetical protein
MLPVPVAARYDAKALIAWTLRSWFESRLRHGRLSSSIHHYQSLDRIYNNNNKSYRWLKFGDIKGETESVIMAAQDRAINTNYFKKKFLKQEIESRCRMCKEYEETIDHLLSGCPSLEKNEYIVRHDKVCTHLHYSICKKLGIETVENWYSRIPKPVTEHEDVTVLWSQGIQTEREVLAYRPDIIIKNKKDKTCLLIDVAIPSDKNVIQK